MNFEVGQLRALQAAVTAGTLGAAASKLGVTPSAVSQRLRALETRVGRRLLLRTRPVTLTADGEIILRLATQIDRLQAHAAMELGLSKGTRGLTTLPVMFDSDSLATWVLPAVGQLAELNETFQITMHPGDVRRAATCFARGEVVAGSSFDSLPHVGCRVHQLGEMRFRARASNDFIAEHFSRGFTLAAARKASLVMNAQSAELADRQVKDADGFIASIVHQLPNAASQFMAIESGWGWGMMPDAYSRLRHPSVTVVPGGPQIDVPLYWHEWSVEWPALGDVLSQIRQAATYALATDHETAGDYQQDSIPRSP